MNIDRNWPTVRKRLEALERLQELIPGELVEPVWKELLAPMYDRLRVTQQWPRGQCFSCRAVHPLALRPSQPRKLLLHQMGCPKYVGPLEHKPLHRNEMMLGNIRVECTCGQHYAERDDNGVRQSCPDKDLDWRGPRRL